MPQPVTLSYDPFHVARGGRVVISAHEQHAAEAGSRAVCAKDRPAYGGPLKIRAPSTVKRVSNGRAGALGAGASLHHLSSATGEGDL
jgi:hypothetical protein